MKNLKVRITFTEEMLGMSPSDPEIYKDFIASKAPDAPSRNEEITAIIETEGIDEAMENRMTIFPKDKDGVPQVLDYQIKGMFKDSCGMLRRVSGTKSKKLTAFKKVIDGLVFVKPRFIPVDMVGEIGVCERPLRASTAQGDRVALAASETVGAGSSIEFEVICLQDDLVPIIEEWLDYGALRGFGGWRNSGKGTFTWEYVE